MGRLSERFVALRECGERALVPFVTAGDPDLAVTEAVVLAMAEAGADVIEIGFPFSDPLAEGPTIQRASERALASGTSLRRVLELVKSLRPRVEIPLVLMGYVNNVLALGERAFAQAAHAAGVDGIIIVDLPPEEGTELYAALRKEQVDPILLAAPTTRPERLEKLVRETRGFLYYVSLTGVTGARSEVAHDVEAGVAAVRAISDVPVCVGFGVSTPEQVARIGAFADGVVVGSALIDRIAGKSASDAADEAGRFVESLKSPLRPAS
jgi:tryptophan synthase alpha chain